jgi:hypothetical protein
MASVILASISIFQFKNEAKEFSRTLANENAVKQHINFILSTTTYPLTSGNLGFNF